MITRVMPDKQDIVVDLPPTPDAVDPTDAMAAKTGGRTRAELSASSGAKFTKDDLPMERQPDVALVATPA